MRIYLAGPMRGMPGLNFPAFDEAAARLRAHGHDVVSPADLDREAGTPQDESKLTPGVIHACLRRDFQRLPFCDAIAVLPGWEKSEYGSLEKAVADACGLVVLDAMTERPLRPASILEDAERIVNGARRKAYGHPFAHHTKTAAYWSILFGKHIPPQKVSMAFILDKLVREDHSPNRDNRVDVAGYANCLDLVNEVTHARASQ